MRQINRYGPILQLFRQVALAFGLAGSGTAAAEFTLLIENVQTAEGDLYISIGDETAFGDAGGKHAVQTILKARAGSMRFCTDALTDGTYAAQVYHDVNGNGELDSNFVGMPREPWGFSNNARGNFGPPKFADTRFEVKGDTRISIRLEK